MSAAPHSLRRRVMLASVLLGAFLSLFFAAASVFLAEEYEHILIDELLRGQAEDYSLRLTTHPEATLPQTRRLRGYLRRPDGTGDVPPELATLVPGIHESENEAVDGIHMGVFDTEHGRLYFVMDLSDIERLEHLLQLAIVVVVIFGTLLAGWIGWMMAGTTIAPVRRLAAAVDALPVQPQKTQLAATVADDELGRLARAMDAYQTRLVDADAAERSFFADASHELRTPVAVVRGAVELLAEEVPEDSGAQRRLQRLDRGVRELTDLTDVLLDLVRRRAPDAVGVDAAALLREFAAEFATRGGLRVRIDAENEISLPQREASLVLRAVVRRLLLPEDPGELAFRASAQVLEVSFRPDRRPDQKREAAGPARSDRNLGLTLVGRLAQQLGWRIEESQDDPGRRVVRIQLRARDS